MSDELEEARRRARAWKAAYEGRDAVASDLEAERDRLQGEVREMKMVLAEHNELALIWRDREWPNGYARDTAIQCADELDALKHVGARVPE